MTRRSQVGIGYHLIRHHQCLMQKQTKGLMHERADMAHMNRIGINGHNAHKGASLRLQADLGPVHTTVVE